MSPEPLQIVEGSRVRRKNVHNKVPVIHQNPVGLIVAFHTYRQLACIFQLFMNLIADRVSLPRIRGSADYEVVGKGS